MREEGVVKSVAEYLGLVSRISERWRQEYFQRWNITDELEWTPWFRGEPECELETALQPKLCRPKTLAQRKRSQLLHEEQELRLEFTRCGTQLFRDGKPSDHWDWYFLMAHSRVPTRLLDWTDSALTALYFALSDRFNGGNTRNGSDAVVYMLDAWWLNDFSFREAHPNVSEKKRPAGLALTDWPEAHRYLPEDPLKTQTGIRARLPLAIEPPHIWQRLAAQRSHFTIFGRELDGLKTLGARKNSRLYQIRIDTRDLESFISDLRIAGITESSIFPDIDGLGRELDMAFGHRTSVAMQRSGMHKELDDPTIRLRPSMIHTEGIGVFPVRRLKKGQFVAKGISRFDYRHLLPWKSIKKLPAHTRNLVRDFCVGTSDGFIPPPDFNFDNLSVEWYFNHSCTGNLGFDAHGDFVALRDIGAGDELSYDYGLVESNPKFYINPCTCGSVRCRKTITGSDWKNAKFFSASDRKFMLPWLRERLEKKD